MEMLTASAVCLLLDGDANSQCCLSFPSCSLGPTVIALQREGASRREALEGLYRGQVSVVASAASSGSRSGHPHPHHPV